MSSPLLRVENLNVSFGDFSVLENVSFTLERGETLAIVGPNGAGKTVLFRALLGSVAYSGTIAWAPGAKIGYVPQKLDLDRQLPFSAADFLHAKSRLAGASQKDIEGALDAVRFERAALAQTLGKLSSGQFQRAMIAFALIGDPDVLLFDEPTASVDVTGEEEIYETLHRLQEDRRLTMLLISHDLHVVYQHATSVLCLNKQQLCYGVPAEALTPETLGRLYGHESRLFHHLHKPA